MPRSSTFSRTARLATCLLLALALVTLAACRLNGPATPVAMPTADRTAEAVATKSAQASATAAGTRRPRTTATPGNSSRPQPVSGLTIPTPPRDEGLPTITFDRLPAQAQEVIRLIARDGPFPYRQDGITFQNREGILPQRPAGYYREYTVETPGSSDRGARRIVAGKQGELYYTDDHYASFKRVVP